MPESTAVCIPDLSSRPFNLTTHYDMDVSPQVVYKAWTEQFDRWFAAPGTVWMVPEINMPFFFETVHNKDRHPHYGRFLRLQPNQLVEITWVTGAGGTKGAETVVTVELAPHGSGTHIHLTHAGFPDAESRDSHAQAWHMVLEQQNKQLTQPS